MKQRSLNYFPLWRGLLLVWMICISALQIIHAQVTTFNYTGMAQTYTVPPGVTILSIEARGAQGGNGEFSGAVGVGGRGGVVTGQIAVTPGQVLAVYVGGRGNNGTGSNTYLAGGFNGGGVAYDANGARGSGGGASDVRVGGNALSNRVIVAGGGGGACCTEPAGGPQGIGGFGGYPNGGPGLNAGFPGLGGTQITGGDAPNGYCGNDPLMDGSLGQGGSMPIGCSITFAGGGAGYYGGGAGNNGGGGSSFFAATVTNVTTQNDVQEGNGLIIITAVPGVAVDCSNMATGPFACDVVDLTDPNTTGGEPTAVGGSAPYTFTYTDIITPGACVNAYTVTRTWTVTDGNNDMATCTQTFTVNDTAPPTITCPAPITRNCQQGTGPNATGFPTVDDNCSPVANITVNRSDVTVPGNCPNNFTIQRTWTATDECGNTASCVQVITVVDDTPPRFIDPADLITITTSAGANCPATATVTGIANGVVASGTVYQVAGVSFTAPALVTHPATNPGEYSDLCDPAPVLTVDIDLNFPNPPNALPCSRVIKITWTVTDACGNATMRMQRFEIIDDEAPTATCPPPLTVSCFGNVPLPNPASVVASDNCTAVTVTHLGDVISNQTCANRYTITRTYGVADACGNSTTCSQVITVNDQTPPTLICPVPATVSCAAEVPAPDPTAVSALDNCGGAVTVVHTGDVISNQTCANRYTITRTYTGTDLCGNTSTCTQIITVNDVTVPTITCPGPLTVSCAAEVPAADPTAVTATDNCGGAVTVVHTGDVISNQTCANRYTITRTYTGTDLCGNTTTCTQTITVNDQTAPVLAGVPADITLSCEDPIPAVPTVTATDNCAGGMAPTAVWINEIHYDNTGADVGEFIEVAGTAGTDLSTYSLVLYNGTGGAVYNTLPLSGTIPNQSNGFGTLSFAYPSNGIQNGAPDGMALVNGATVIQFLSYEGSFTAVGGPANGMMSTDIGVLELGTEPAGLSLQLFGTGNAYSAFTWSAPSANTPGAINSQQTFTAPPAGSIPLVFTSVTVTGACANESVITRTWTATDVCGNAATGTHTITIVDDTDPVLVCPDAATVSCATDVPTPAPSTVMATDNCAGPVSVAFSNDVISNQTCPNRYTVTRTYYGIDICGNDATCTQTITVDDQTAPVLAGVPADITVNCEDPFPPLPVVTATDNCGGVPAAPAVWINEIHYDNTGADVNEFIEIAGTAGVNLTGYSLLLYNGTGGAVYNTLALSGTIPNQSNGFGTLAFTYPVNGIQNGAPDGMALVNGATVIQFLSYEGSFTAVGGAANGMMSTDIGVLESGADPVGFSLQLFGTGNNYGAFTWSAPSAETPGAVNSQQTFTPAAGGPIPVTRSSFITAGNCPNNFLVTRRWTATDACGNNIIEEQVITVQDVTDPVPTCPAPVNVVCATDVPTPDITLVTATDNCQGNITIAFVNDQIVNQTCQNSYQINRTYSATDACGNAGTCVQVITVNDNVPPTITCPAPIQAICASGVPAPDPGSVVASDNCNSGAVVTFISDVISNQTCASRYTITRTYRATDACGNTADCTQTITVDDQIAPSISCPAPVNVSCASAVPAPDPASVTASDNCGTVTVTFVSDVISNQTCANRYTLTRTYRATDACGNTAECTQIITVIDVTPPTITCPAPVTVSCASAVPAPAPASVTATDNCGGGVTVTFVSDVISNQTCANRFTVTRTYRATDVCGNTADCTQIITVNDVTPPSITCPAPVTVSCAALVPAPNTASVTATDNCGGAVTVVFVSDVISNQTCANRFTVTRTYRATDVCGNASTCTQIITVNDVTPPTFTFVPANVTVECDAVPARGNPTATDNCAGGPVTITFVSEVRTNGNCRNNYVLTRTWRATDVCGNASTATQTVTVRDTRPPTITVAARSETIECLGLADNNQLLQAWVNRRAGAQAVDNCGNVTWTNNFAELSDGCGFTGSATVTFTATDECGNASTTVATFTIVDTTPPSLVEPARTCEVECLGAAGNDAKLQEWLATNGGAEVVEKCGNVTWTNNFTGLSDDCGLTGRTTVTFTATDECGNRTSTTASFIIFDTKAPVGRCEYIEFPVSCVEDIPCPEKDRVIFQQLSDRIKSGYVDYCGNVTAEVSFFDEIECSDYFSNGKFIFGRIYYFIVKDECGNIVNAECPVAYLGTCKPFCSFDQNFWGSTESQFPDKNFGKTTRQMVQSLLSSWGPMRLGTPGRSITIEDADCLLTYLPSGGPSVPLAQGDVNASNGNCSALPNEQTKSGRLRNTLLGNVIALDLNMRYNRTNIGQELALVNLNTSCIPYPMGVMMLMDSLNLEPTVGSAFRVANWYLGGAYSNNPGYNLWLGDALNQLMVSINEYWNDCTIMDRVCLDKVVKHPGQSGTDRTAAVKEIADLEVMPNPADLDVHVQFHANKAGETDVILYDLNGKPVYFETEFSQIGLNRFHVPLNGISSGLYTVLVRQGGAWMQKRLVITNQ